MPPRKKAKLDVDWSWAGIEAEKPEEISAQHRRRAAGLHGVTPCRFDPYPTDAAESSTSSRKKVEAGCSARLCKGKPRCYNYLGADKVLASTAKDDFVEKKVGPAPEMRSGSEPIGLRNMGATCYANAFLQLWYHNIAFRNGLYSCITTEGSKLHHLVQVFTHLQRSKRKVVDPSGLVKALKLDTGAQQDAGEFSKLFMNVIDIELRRQQNPELRRLYEQLFQGKLAYETQCQGCGARNEREESFLELELSLKNNDTLSDRIRALTQPELLDGDNKYRCSACTKLCAATRQVDLRVLPRYLNFGLMRFTYDIKDGERRKSKAAIRYPKSATFSGFRYDLCAVVIHLGSSPYHGHFICELLDASTKEWYTFSDEQVTKRIPNALRRLGQPDDGLEVSKDAYMLVYKKESSTADPLPVSPPEHTLQTVTADNTALEQEMAEWVKRGELAGVEFETLKTIKEPVIAALSGVDIIVPRHELVRWLEGDMGGLSKPIDFASITCRHTTEHTPYLDPSKMDNVRLISRQAFDLIRGTTPCAEIDICPTCIEETFKYKVSVSDREDQVREFDELNGTGRVINLVDESAKYLISKVWLDKWRKHALSVDSLPTDNGYSLYCGHDAPWPGSRPYCKITAEALVLLRSAVGDFDAFDDNAEVCGLCAEDGQVDEDARKVWLEELKKDKAFKREIRPSGTIYNVNYYILSALWMAQWRLFLVTPGSRPQYRADICEHGGIPFDPGNDGVEYITEKGWTILQAIYGTQREITMQFKPNPIPSKKFSISDVSVAVCEPCRLVRRLDWVETDISIYLDEEGDSATGIEGQADDKPGLGVAMSRRRSSRRVRKPLMMSITKSTSVKDIRLRILASFNISPISQSLWYGDLELTDGEQTMRDIGMVCDGELRLVELQQQELKEDGANGRAEGFGGTALLGIRECPDCTYHNEPGADGCVICGRPFL